MSWTVADIADQSGRTAVVTGANGGLGLATARALAGAGAHVVMAARNQQKAEAARAGIAADVDGGSLEIVPLDLTGNRELNADFDAVVMEGCGHYPQLERPDEFNAVLSQSLA